MEGLLVRLRRVEPEDAPALLAILNHPALSGRRFVPHKVPQELPLSSHDAEEIISSWRGSEDELHFVILLRDDDSVIGHASFSWGWDTFCPWLSVVIDPDRWRQGLGSDALRMLLDHVFNSTVAHSASCWLPEWSEEALAFARKHGFQVCGRVRRSGVREGRFYDDTPVDLLRPEWMAGRVEVGDAV